MTAADRPDPIQTTAALNIPDGPWNADVWVIQRPLRHVTSGEITCAVATCDGPAGRAEGDPIQATDVLCIPHRQRFWKGKVRGTSDVSEFIKQQATCSRIQPPRGRPPARKPYCTPIDFTRVSSTLANELRYIAAVKTRRMMWRDGDYIAKILGTAIDLAVKYTISSFREFPLPPANLTWRESCRFPMFPNETSSGARTFAGVVRGMRMVLDEATADPWAADVWHATDMDLSGRNNLRAAPKVYWSRVTCDWLRRGLKSLAREQLQSGSRAWGTIHTYTRGGSAFSRYLEEVGDTAPSDMSRAVFLDFVAWMRDEDCSPTDLHAVNTLARLLTDLRVKNIVPELPETTYLLRGENVVPKTRKPKPFPADLLAAIDRFIADESALPRTERLILRLCRATGPRSSEALMLPRDSVSYVDGRGYTLEYFQSKVNEWRRVPLPPKLGQDLVAQKQWVAETYGPDCKWMFPYAGPRPRQHIVTHVNAIGPWPYKRFHGFLWKLYQKHGIVHSALTGETLTGPQLHRFRHSIATGLLNEGWSQYEVQTFLGHKSPTMMQAYAEINDDRQRDKYLAYIDGIVDIEGRKAQALDEASIDVERLRDRMMRSTLPNGFCTLPEKQKCEYLPSPCLSCSFFRTTRTFLPIHIRQRDEAIRELDIARTDGRQRAAEVHEKTITQLNKIIDGLNQVPESAGGVDVDNQ